MDLVTLFAAAIDTVPTNGPVPPPSPDGGGGGGGDFEFWNSMLSGSFGALITLFLTGWWNWRDREEAKKSNERELIQQTLAEVHDCRNAALRGMHKFRTESSVVNYLRFVESWQALFLAADTANVKVKIFVDNWKVRRGFARLKHEVKKGCEIIGDGYALIPSQSKLPSCPEISDGKKGYREALNLWRAVENPDLILGGIESADAFYSELSSTHGKVKQRQNELLKDVWNEYSVKLSARQKLRRFWSMEMVQQYSTDAPRDGEIGPESDSVPPGSTIAPAEDKAAES